MVWYSMVWSVWYGLSLFLTIYGDGWYLSIAAMTIIAVNSKLTAIGSFRRYIHFGY